MPDGQDRKTIKLNFGKVSDDQLNVMASDTLGTTKVSPLKLYRTRNYASILTHYGLTAGLAAGAIALSPVWAVITATVLTGGISYIAIKGQKELMENGLEKLPRSSDISPHLGDIADELYAKSGLKAEGNPIYDFKSDEEKLKNVSGLAKLFAKMQNMAALTHNAAAARLGRPIIMASRPLLKVLDDKEEKAVIAHEFAHAAARHSLLTMPAQLIAGAAAMSVGLAVVGAVFSLGWVPLLITAAASIVAGKIIKNVLTSSRDRKLLDKEDKNLDFTDIVKKKKISGRQKLLGSLVNASVVTAFKASYLPLYLASKAAGAAAKLIGSDFARSIEYQADRGAVVYGADPLALATGLRKLELVNKRSIEQAYWGKPMPKKNFLTKTWAKMTSDHPTTDSRVKRLCKLAKMQGQSDELIEKARSGELDVPKDNDMSPALLKKLALGPFT